ncbi:hypothetical protein [Pontibacter sp. H249]|uniref:hypothetical protein n=1 Tax=Pontibacter sp. H249 TaxID=3133420 RepID=UPI0030C3C7C8
MKKFTIYTLAPALALLALGCSGPTAMQSTEYDDMYYSSTDKTTYVEPQTNTYSNLAEGTEEAQQQTYSQSNNGVTEDYYADEYYDGREYNPRDNWYQPNYSYVDPYWGSAYTPRHYSYNRFYNRGFYDPFYDPFLFDPFYDPFFHRPFWGSGVSVMISYNYGWGSWGGWGRPYHSRWFAGNPYYHGFYGNNYGYGNNWIYDRPIIVGNRIKTQYGPRDARGAVVTDGNRGNGGRPVRGEAYQGDVTGTENARPARPSRSSGAVVAPEAGSESKTSLPARPSRTEYYDPSQGRTRTTRQPVKVGEQRQQQQRVIQPSERRNTRQYTPTPRSTESRPSRTREYVPRQQQQQRPIQQSRPSYEQRRESSFPSRSSEVRRESSSSSSSGTNNSGSRGSRPTRGQ